MTLGRLCVQYGIHYIAVKAITKFIEATALFEVLVIYGRVTENAINYVY